MTGCGAEEGRDMRANEVAAELRGLRIEPGLWEVSSQVLDARGPNLPRQAQAEIKAHRRAVRHCITPAQAARPEANFLRMERDGDCAYRGFTVRDGRMRGRMRCREDGEPGMMTTEMDGRYGPRDYDMRMRMVSTGMPEGANMTIETRTTGRRLGACPPAAPQPSEGGPA